MREQRAADARKKAGVLAECLAAWMAGSETIDAEVGAFVVAETILMWRQSVTKK